MDNYSQQNTVHSGTHSWPEAISRVYGWMFFGLIITAVMSYATITVEPLQRFVFSSPLTIFALIIVEFVFVWVIAARAMKMSYGAAALAFMFYSALNGLTLSSIFLIYTSSSITMAFVITAGFFGFMSVYGLVTKQDLTSLGSLLFAGVIGVIIASLANWFLKSDTLSYIIAFIGVAIFLGLTAYDSQKIKAIHSHYAGTPKEKNVAIIGALTLYLDFINLFLFILRILGRKN